ncbi:serine/threonine-protein kinase 31-like isoform X2 [Oscarella lobularis]|uniref:serine/threonine-protein kinase 31-like isoform X2 n=1 Tax=Oscarella lobularis TaxID=121494 RepID=UPI0033140DF5
MSASEGKLESGFDLRVGNLSVDVRKNDVLRLVEEHAKVSSINHYALTSKDKRQGRTTGYAFVHFPNDEEAERAERALSGTMFFGRLLQIARAPRRSNRGEYRSGTSRRASPAPAEPPTEKMSLIITSVETDCSFWAQVSNDESKLQQLQKCLKSWCPKTAAVGIPDVGQIYGAVFEEDSNWYRCKLIQSEAGMDKIIYIDYGNEIEIESGKLVELPESYSQIPAYARRYFLTGIQIEETHFKEVYEMLKSMIGDAVASQCYFTPCDFIPCMLFSHGNNVASQLIERGHAHKLDLTAFGLQAVLYKVMWEREIFRNEIKREKRSKALLQTQMQNVIPEKFNKLADLLAELPSLRRSVKKHLDLSEHPLEKAYQVLVNREEVIDLDHMTTLKEVEGKLNVFTELQQKIGCCDDKSSLESMIKSRDESRLQLVNSLQVFLNVVSLISMDERYQKLQETKDLLISFSKGWNRIVDPAPTLETALNRYQQWKVSCTKEFESLPEKTDELVHKLKTSMTSWVNSRDSESEASEEFRFMGNAHPQLLQLLEEEARESLKCMSSKVPFNEEMEIVMQAFLTAIADEQKSIKHLQDALIPHYESLHSELSTWVEAKPDVTSALETFKTLCEIRKKISMKRMEIEEMSFFVEENDAMIQAKEELNKQIVLLHETVEKEKILLTDLHAQEFPELFSYHPQLQLSAFLETKGLFVAPGLELSNFVMKCLKPGGTLFKTEYCGKPALLESFSGFERGGSFEKRVVSYAGVQHPNVVPVYCIMYQKDPSMAIVLSGCHENIGLASWLESDPPIKERISVVSDWLEGLKEIHSLNLIHASISTNTIIIVKEEEKDTVKGYIPTYNFSQTDAMRAALLPEVQGDPGTFTAISWQLDVYCVGMLAERIFNGILCSEPQASDFVMKMVRKNAKSRPSVATLLEHPFLARKDDDDDDDKEEIIKEEEKEDHPPVSMAATGEAETEEYLDASDSLPATKDAAAAASGSCDEPEVTEE